MRQAEKRLLRLERRPLAVESAAPYTGPKITVSVSAPPTPAVNDLWVDI
jgi:hypothetical protein